MDEMIKNRKPDLLLQRGQSLLEFAMVLPLLLLIALGAIEFGRAYYQYNTLSKAVREAARYMSMQTYDSLGRDRAKNMAVYGNRQGTGTPCLPGLTVGNIVITPRDHEGPPAPPGPSDTNPPRWVKISVTGYTFQSMFPRVVPINASLTPSVEMRYVGLNAWLNN